MTRFDLHLPGRGLCAAFIVALTAALLFAAPTQAQRPSINSLAADHDDILDAIANLNGGGGNGGGGFDMSNHVVLVNRLSPTTSCEFGQAYFRINPDGTQDLDEYQVPAGHTLILTDIKWQAKDGPTDFFVGRNLFLILTSQDVSGGQPLRVYISPPVLITTENENTLLGGSENLNAGVPVGAFRIICPEVFNRTQSAISTNLVFSTFLRGILVPD